MPTAPKITVCAIFNCTAYNIIIVRSTVDDPVLTYLQFMTCSCTHAVSITLLKPGQEVEPFKERALVMEDLLEMTDN